jgi:hypothetical protein
MDRQNMRKFLHQVIICLSLYFFLFIICCCQIWDIVESPVFMVVYGETLDTSYRLCYDYLRKFIFQHDPSTASPGFEGVSTAHLKSPPLASILPQLKSISIRFVPDSSHDLPLSNDIRNISSGPLLDSLCINIFDAEDE